MFSLTSRSADERSVQAHLALALRVGLALVFIIGGTNKLLQLLAPSEADAIVASYVGPSGYINQVFLDWMFSGTLPGFITPWSFLTVLSGFELVSGLMLVMGLMVRPLAVVWGLLLWSFVFSLPVVTTPGIQPDVETYMSPALFVQIRDIALSGFFFALYNLGAGAGSLDSSRFGLPNASGRDWQKIGLLLRLSLGVVFLIGGFFHGFHKVTTYNMPALVLIPIGLMLVVGLATRYAAFAAGAVLLATITLKIDGATSIIGYFNSVKREFGLLAAAGVLAFAGGGQLFSVLRARTALEKSLRVYGGVNQAPQHQV